MGRLSITLECRQTGRRRKCWIDRYLSRRLWGTNVTSCALVVRTSGLLSCALSERASFDSVGSSTDGLVLAYLSANEVCLTACGAPNRRVGLLPPQQTRSEHMTS